MNNEHVLHKEQNHLLYEKLLNLNVDSYTQKMCNMQKIKGKVVSRPKFYMNYAFQ